MDEEMPCSNTVIGGSLVNVPFAGPSGIQQLIVLVTQNSTESKSTKGPSEAMSGSPAAVERGDPSGNGCGAWENDAME
jgi:hypothetical protein